MEQYRRMESVAGLVFFDRCVLDALAGIDQVALATTVDLQSLLVKYEYFRTAFIFPPWEEIYTTDAERDHTFSHAVAVHEEIAAWYPTCGYDLVEVPRGTVQERSDFILERVSCDDRHKPARSGRRLSLTTRRESGQNGTKLSDCDVPPEVPGPLSLFNPPASALRNSLGASIELIERYTKMCPCECE